MLPLPALGPDLFTVAEAGSAPRFCGTRTVLVLSATLIIKAPPATGSVPSPQMNVSLGNEIFF